MLKGYIFIYPRDIWNDIQFVVANVEKYTCAKWDFESWN